jgi:hypothetical protein
MTMTETTEMSELSTSLLGIHRAMREDCRRLIGALEQLPGGDLRRATALSRAFDAVARMAADHHEAEDQLLWPLLLAYSPEFTPAAAALEGAHAGLDLALSRVSGGFLRLSTDPTPAGWAMARVRLVHDAEVLYELLASHLDREEEVVLPALTVLDPAALREAHRLVMHRNGLRELAFLVPWIVSHAAHEEKAEIRSKGPKGILILHDLVWRRRFARLMAPLSVPR